MRRLFGRPRSTAAVAIAVLCAFTIVAGVVVSRLLPDRLALWQQPRIAARRLAAPDLVLGAATGVAGPRASATSAGVARVIGPMVSSPVFGPQLGVLVTDLATGRVLYARNPAAGFAPASTNKLATAVAALQVLGASARFTTTVVARSGASSIVLVGGGDPTLAAGPPPASDYPQPATLAGLARQTATALRARGVHSVRLGYDVSLYSGPGLATGWPQSYVTTGNVSVITPLEVDQGRVTRAGKPADNEASGGPRAADPAALAAASFAGFLTADGITVRGAVRRVAAPADASTLASVESPPLAAIVQWMLEESNNVIAENLARHVALATGRPASFSGAASAVTAVLRRLGVTGELSLVDGSGLSPDDSVAPAVLVHLISLAASHPALRPVLTGLPVEGFSGTLTPGSSVFGLGGPAGLGVVRAKTGNLSTVAALAGTAYARNGQLIAFAVMADKIPAANLVTAATSMVEVASALAGCGCR
ncbi:MAG TPA: D-alanyl-D-alanine carboxypeptidase/D-alanyl-D-alanine-endopeptidase [Streptosporangiaceae bacterium]|nr:D-alanyl-D-alanine carboxypeptidase/D-alanyl-D-alanine-endopeptidase [Streptosporangiaceae bacterium]